MTLYILVEWMNAEMEVAYPVSIIECILLTYREK